MEVINDWLNVHPCIINKLQGDLFTISLAIIGVGVSVFTLLYSFIYSYRQNVLDLKYRLENGEDDPRLEVRYNNGIAFIKRIGKYGKKCIIILLISVVIAISDWINLRFVQDKLTNLICLIACLIMLIITIVYSSYLFFKIHKQYQKDLRL